ncbi:MAG: PEPxxWA-CTERM sorting domain-containing protein [Phenylobacterium sp.]
MKTLPLFASAAAMAIMLVGSSAQAAVIFASFDTGTSNANNIDWVSTGTGGSIFSTSSATSNTLGAAAVKFTFLGDPSLADFDHLNAALTLSGSVTNTPAMFDGATYTQTAINNGSFSFLYTGPSETLDGKTLVKNSTVLFSGTFSGAWIQGAGGVGGLDVTIANGGNAVFSSSIYDLSNAVPGSDEFTFHLGTVTPNFASTNPSTSCTGGVCANPGTTSLNSFRAHAGGDFQDLQLTVPEPATWALMIMGFGGAGVMLRRRRTAGLPA